MDKLRNILEVHPISPEKQYQNRIWQRLSDDEINRISNRVPIFRGVDTNYKPAGVIKRYEYTKLLEKVKSKRLIDLGSAHRTMRDVGDQIDLERLGIKEYIAVDYDLNEEYISERSPSDKNYEDHINCIREWQDPSYKLNIPNPTDRIKSKGMRMEILKALHSFPENYGSAVITSLDPSTFYYEDDWMYAVVAELKRVVPKDEFIVTDGMGFIFSVLEDCVPAFKDAKDMNKLSKYACKPDDPYNGGKKNIDKHDRTNLGNYVIDAPEIGFRIYFDNLSYEDTIVIINTSKTPA